MKVKLKGEPITHDYFSELMRLRGVKDLQSFLNPDSSVLNDPSNLRNIERGFELYTEVLLRKKVEPNILILADCDVDGFTSAAIMYLYTKHMSPKTQIDYLLHTGKQHGLEDKIEEILDLETQYDLLIVPDAATNDNIYFDKLKEIGLPVLVLDHHDLEKEESDYAVIINNQISPAYSNKALTGAGVAWQFCRYCDEQMGDSYADSLIDLAALGIDGDMGSVLSLENRYIMLKGFSNVQNFFFKTLIEKRGYSMNYEVNPITVAFYIVPLINAMIRVGSQEEKERLFLAFVDGERLVPSNKRGSVGIPEKVAVESARECDNAKARQQKIVDEAVLKLESKIFKYDLLENKILLIQLEDEKLPSELTGSTLMAH